MEQVFTGNESILQLDCILTTPTFSHDTRDRANWCTIVDLEEFMTLYAALHIQKDQDARGMEKASCLVPSLPGGDNEAIIQYGINLGPCEVLGTLKTHF